MMDSSVKGAELALHIARFVQMPVGSADWPDHWVFVLRGGRRSRAEAIDLLAQCPKPLLVAPLVEPGMLALWTTDALAGDERRRIEHEFANQVEAVASRVSDLGLSEASRILCETAAGRADLTVADFRTCFRDFAVIAGWSLIKGPDDAYPGRLVIRKSAEHWSPGGPSRHPGSAT